MRVTLGRSLAGAAILLVLTLGQAGCSAKQVVSNAAAEPTPPRSNYTVHTRPGIDLVAYEYQYAGSDGTRTAERIQLWTKDGLKLGGVEGHAAAIAPDGVYYRTQVDPSTTGEIRFLGSDGTSRVVGPNPKAGEWEMVASPSGRQLFLRPWWIIDTRTGVARRLLADMEIKLEADWVDDETLVTTLGRRGLVLIRGNEVTRIEGTADAGWPSANGRLIAYWTPTYPESYGEGYAADKGKALSTTLAVLDLDHPEASRVLTDVVAPVRGYASWLDDDTLSVSKFQGGGRVMTELIDLE